MTFEEATKAELGNLMWQCLVHAEVIRQKDAEIAKLKSLIPPPSGNPLPLDPWAPEEPKPGDA